MKLWKRQRKAAENAGYKIGIMTTTVSQAEEEYRVAEELAAEYPDTVVHVTFPDNFATEMETTISTALSLASDPDMKAIIFTQSVSGTAARLIRFVKYVMISLSGQVFQWMIMM